MACGKSFDWEGGFFWGATTGDFFRILLRVLVWGDSSGLGGSPFDDCEGFLRGFLAWARG